MSATATFVDLMANAHAAGNGTGFVFVQNDGTERRFGFADLVEAARARGRKLRALGLGKGDRLALIIPEADEFVLTFLAAITQGIIPVPLYPPLSLGRLDAYLDGTVRILEAAQAQLLVTTAQVQKILWSIVPRVPTLTDLITIEKVEKTREDHGAIPATSPDDTVFLQFTSGSTSAPRGVVVTHASLVANAKAIIVDGLQAEPDRDKGVTWLPLYHDMGLIGFVLAPFYRSIPVVFIPTMSFVRRPTLWMDMITKHKGTLTFAPNFAFARVAKRATDADLARWELSQVRVVGCGAEPIHAGTMRMFIDKLAPRGLKPESILPCYGMAEATLAMSFVGIDETMHVDTIDADRCYEEGVAEARFAAGSTSPATAGAQNGVTGAIELVACGRTFPGHEIGIFADDGTRLPDRRIGEIRFRGPSVAGGYFRDAASTAQTFLADGWLKTGDLGYVAEGRLYISGRKKDILIVHGRNYYPQGIEWLVEEVPGVRKGNVVVFSVPGDQTEEVVVVAETNEKAPEKRAEIATAIKKHLSEAMQLSLHDARLLGVGELPKTTSGKVQRRKTRQQYLDKSLGSEGVRSMGSSAEKLELARHLAVSFVSRVRHTAKSFLARARGQR